MAAPTGTVPMNDFAQAGVPVALANGTTAFSQLVTSVDGTGTALPVGSTADPYASRQLGSGALANNQVAVGTTGTLVVAARTGRQSVTISSTSAVVFYIGNAVGVTASTGLYVAGTAGASITINTAAAVYAVGVSAVTLSYLEAY